MSGEPCGFGRCVLGLETSMQCSSDGIGRMDGDWVRFANTGPFSPLLLWRFPKPHAGSATILVDELHPDTGGLDRFGTFCEFRQRAAP